MIPSPLTRFICGRIDDEWLMHIEAANMVRPISV